MPEHTTGLETWSPTSWKDKSIAQVGSDTIVLWDYRAKLMEC